MPPELNGKFTEWALWNGIRLRESAEIAPEIRVDLDEAYLDAISRIEALEQNRTGADKSWVRRAEHEFRQHYLRVRRV